MSKSAAIAILHIFLLFTLSVAPSAFAAPTFTPIAAPPVKKPAPPESKDLAPDTIFKRYKDAVVRIEVTLQGASLGVGSGFFYSAKGEIATSLHVIRPFLVHPGTEMTVKLANGKIFRAAKIGACGDDRGVDLCLLKVDHVSKSILPLESDEVSPGESIVAIGHPRGLDFSISTGVVSALRQHPSGWNEVQIDAAISPGNSGGPIINRYGQAVGVVYQFERDGQNLNFGILTPEADVLARAGVPFLATADARKDFADRAKRLARKSADKWTKPSIQSFNDIKLRPTGMKWMRALLGATSFTMLLPENFQNCERSDDGETAATACSSVGGDLVVTVQKRKRSLEGSLAAYRGRKLVETRTLSLVERLETEGSWNDSKTNRAAFTSRPSPARCAVFQKKTVTSSDETTAIAIRKKGFFQDASSICRFETENDSEPGAISTSQWIEVGNDFYGVNVWSADPGRLPFLQSLADLVLVSAGASSDEVKTPYRAYFRPTLKRDQNVQTASIAGADLSDTYSDDTSTVTIVRTSAVTPAQMNRQFLKWAGAVAKSPNLKPFNGDDVALTEIAGHAARVGSWLVSNPSDRRKTSLLMMAATFGPDATWVIYELQPVPSNAGRAPSKSLTSDMERFRAWTQEFQPSH